MIFRECELCGAALDPGERCNCKEEAEREKQSKIAEYRAILTRSFLTTPPRKKKRP